MSDIHIEAVFPPIPVRQFDYRATFDGYEPGDAMGYGRTADDARADLLEQIDDTVLYAAYLAGDAALTAAWEAYLAGIPMHWLRS